MTRTGLDSPVALQVPKIPMLNSNFVEDLVTAEVGVRLGLKPLNVVQPQGPSFSVDGNHVNWQKWDFRVSFNYREGLVLHDVKWVIPHHLYHLHVCTMSCRSLPQSDYLLVHLRMPRTGQAYPCKSCDCTEALHYCTSCVLGLYATS